MTEEGLPTASLARSPPLNDTHSSPHHDAAPEPCDETLDRDAPGNDDDDDDDDDGFGDFDEFEEGGDQDDFGDFDNGFQQGEHEAETTFDNPLQHQPPVPAPSPGPVSNMQSSPSILRSPKMLLLPVTNTMD